MAAGATRRACIGARAVPRLADGEHGVVVVLVVAARALRVAIERLVGRLFGCGLGCRLLVLRRGAEREERQEEQRVAGHFMPALISFGPGPSGSVCATPKWHSMQVIFSAFALAWRACAFSLCFENSTAVTLWQSRHSCESLAIRRFHSRAAMS